MRAFKLLTVVFGSLLLLFEGYPTLAVNNCTWGQFQCDNRRCIKVTFRCDKNDDCGDNSDEKGCGEVCTNRYFRCGNRKCISRMHMCDGDNDCGDGFDETQHLCGSGSAPLTCIHCNAAGSAHCSHEVQCSRRYTRCVRFAYVSNGTNIIESTCATKSDCTPEGIRKQCLKRGDECKMQCCKRNRCNKAESFDNSIWSPHLTCYQCNIHNWQSCNTKVTCPGNEGYDRCFRMSYTRIESGKDYPVMRTGCATQSNCTGANSLCSGHDGSNCKFECCHNSSCNVPKIDETSSKSNIKCYKCSSKRSLQDCKDRKILQTCSDNEDRCYDAQVITDHKNDEGVPRMFYKGCTPVNKCNSTTLDVCKRHIKSTSCTVKCCTGDGCNAGSSLLVSRFAFMACVSIYVYLCIGLSV
ncbi:low-density lipoprotein receptor-related protein 1B-like [Actinia tenebrosa]|uniref:Low-density lipoprotein receptor-related protein 1B-like n=1 Tax=Actinia tenebrosa TaxID=6105 RepID=A0A6P8I7U6_ACTTE|nr:low-density lipoprotein receptor-related protein 1B-like [Actinia tenebrosa]